MPMCSSARFRSADDSASASLASEPAASRTCTSPCRTVSTTRTSPRAFGLSSRVTRCTPSPLLNSLVTSGITWLATTRGAGVPDASAGAATWVTEVTCGADWVGAGAVVSGSGRHRCLRPGPVGCRVGCVVLRLVRGPGLCGVRRRQRGWSSGLSSRPSSGRPPRPAGRSPVPSRPRSTPRGSGAGSGRARRPGRRRPRRRRRPRPRRCCRPSSVVCVSAGSAVSSATGVVGTVVATPIASWMAREKASAAPRSVAGGLPRTPVGRAGIEGSTAMVLMRPSPASP